MKKFLIFLAVAGVVLGSWFYHDHQPSVDQPPLIGGTDFHFTNTSIGSNGTSTVINTTTWTALKYSGNGSQGYVSFCDNADSGVNVNNPVYLGFGATSTKPFGFRLASGACHRMTLADDNMFYGTVYAIASGAATTILEIYK